MDANQPIRLMNEPQEQGTGARVVLQSLLPASSPELAQDLDRLTSEEFVFRLLLANWWSVIASLRSKPTSSWHWSPEVARCPPMRSWQLYSWNEMRIGFSISGGSSRITWKNLPLAHWGC